MTKRYTDETVTRRETISAHFSEDCKRSSSMTARADVTVIVVHYDLTDPTQCVFHRDAEIYFLVYTKRSEDYGEFFAAVRDAAQAKQAREYGLDMANQRCR